MQEALALADIFEKVIAVLIILAPIWVPVLLIYAFWTLWINYITMKTIASEKFVLLEIKLPKEIEKSPAAMEIVLSAFWQPDPSAHFIDRYWKGKITPWFSLELVSLGGEVHIFIRVPKSSKNAIESRIYSQYSNIEIYEVPDYTQLFDLDRLENDIWGTEYAFTKPDPYPIQTYVDYKLHENPKEFHKVDPLLPLIEFLGSLKPGQQAWHQILIRKHEKRRGRKYLFKKTDWRDDAKDLVDKLKKDWTPKEGNFSEFGITEAQRNTIKAIERSITKNAFDVGVRSILLGTNDVFDKTNIGGLVGSFLQVNSPDLNAFKLSNVTGIKYPWQDYKETRLNIKKQQILAAYKARGFFYPPFKGKHVVLNSEELATIFHFPGDVAQTPTFGRISSKKAEPPANLPTK